MLNSDEDVLEKMAYTIANPTAAGLVRSPREWPGVVSLRLAERFSVDRPDVFFDPEGPLPGRATLNIVRPPIYPRLDDAELAQHLASAIERHVREARSAMAEQRRNFAGAKAVLRQAFDGVPSSTEPRCSPSPRIAVTRTLERVQAISDLLSFYRRYRFAWAEWRAGARDTMFAFGTYSVC